MNGKTELITLLELLKFIMEKIEHLWWPTPVWEVKTDFDKNFNQNLLKEIYQSKVKNQKDKTNETSLFHNIENDDNSFKSSLIPKKSLSDKLESDKSGLHIVEGSTKSIYPSEKNENSTNQ